MTSYTMNGTHSVSQPSAPIYPNLKQVHTISTQGITYAGQQQQPIVVQSVGGYLGDNLSDRPILLTCPYCHETMTTRIEEQVGGLALLVTIITFFIIPGCNFFFLCSSCLKDKKHYCSRCHRLVGKKQSL